MCRTIIRRAWLLAMLAALAPGVAVAEDATGYGLPYIPVPVPTGGPHVAYDGGFFVGASVLMMNQTNTLGNQAIAQRGFQVTDDSVFGSGSAGFHVGSGNLALTTQQLRGPTSFQPGFEVDLGYKFYNGMSVYYDFMYLTDAKYQAAATLNPPGGIVGTGFAETFLFSPVYNYPAAYDGPNSKIPLGGPQAVSGIWNGASTEVISYIQRFQQHEIVFRDVVYETENYRISSLLGPRITWIWERFYWHTEDIDNNTGATSPINSANYTNVVSNRMYGAFAGCSQEWYWAHGFAVQLDLAAALFVDGVKEEAKYELGLKYAPPQSKRTVTQFNIVPEVEARLGIQWYPYEGIQLGISYNAMGFFNTVTMDRPVDFNYSALTPHYADVFRLFNGIQAHIGLIF